jgi:hypothetical protein
VPYPMDVVREDRDLDVAELEVTTQASIEPVFPPVIGDVESGAVCSFAAWPVPQMRCGETAAYVSGGTYTADFASVRGNSGAGAYDVFGRLVGIVVRATGDRTWIAPLDQTWLAGT